MFGACATVDADAGATWDLLDDGQEAVEAWRLGDGEAIYECGDEVVGVFEGIADGELVLSVTVKEFATDSFADSWLPI